MRENKMAEVAKLLGVEIDEIFYIQGIGLGREMFKAKITLDGLKFEHLDVCNNGESHYLDLALQGKLEVEKMPWEQKKGEDYYYPSVADKEVGRLRWNCDTFDLALKSLGMVYRSEREAWKHFKDDYKKLTGKDYDNA